MSSLIVIHLLKIYWNVVKELSVLHTPGKSSAYKPELLNYLKISSILKDFLACVPLENDRKNSIVGGKPIFI